MKMRYRKKRMDTRERLSLALLLRRRIARTNALLREQNDQKLIELGQRWTIYMGPLPTDLLFCRKDPQ